MKGFIKVSKLLQPVNIVPKNAVVKPTGGLSKSQKLLVDNGYVRPCGPGLQQLMPLGVRVVEKLCSVISIAMEDIGAQRVSFPALSGNALWKKSGRWDVNNAELFKFKDRHNKDYLLCPTQEEMAAEVLALIDCPGLIYQIGPKYRDEPRPKGGLLRAREFIMKDMYSGDVDKTSAEITYARVRNQYDLIMKQLHLPAVWAKGDVGDMGGIESHELHLTSPAGEDNIRLCNSCNQGVNSELNQDTCPLCSASLADPVKSIEVGHTFLLGTRYSVPLEIHALGTGKTKLLFMGSYGIGITRLAAASVEVLSSEEVIRWPLPIAPYSVVLIPPKAGSAEVKSNKTTITSVSSQLSTTPFLVGDLLLDDRPLTIGRRLVDAKKWGIPIAVVVGGKNAFAEIHNLHNETEELADSAEEVVDLIEQILVPVDLGDDFTDEARM